MGIIEAAIYIAIGAAFSPFWMKLWGWVKTWFVSKKIL